MPKAVRAVREWWNADRLRGWLVVGGFAYALFFSQGIPMWDDDFTTWFRRIWDQSIWRILWEIVSPFSTQPEHWGFNERPIEKLVYKFFYLVTGREAWSYWVFKSAVYAGLGLMMYQWGIRLVPKGAGGRWAALAAAVFFLANPGTMASFLLYQDFAPVAELLFLALTYWIWREVERTPADWRGLPSLRDPDQRRWILRWTLVAVATYLGYKSKADLKLIPAILGAYVLVTRRKQLGFFAVPIAQMLLLAVPWGPGVFGKLPPFMPGSQGSEIGYMWQPASADRLLEYLWDSRPYEFVASLSRSTIALSGLLGPFLILAIALFVVWRIEGLDLVPWTRLETSIDRSRLFVLIWTAVILVGISALPAINYIFRIRYGILHMVPVCLLLAWVFGLFADSARRLPWRPWTVGAAVALLAVQGGINVARSVTWRRDMGQVIVAVDQVYAKFEADHGDKKLTLLPDFRPYDYWPDAPKSFDEKTWLQNVNDLSSMTPGETYVISWNPSLWDQTELVGGFNGCKPWTLFDRVFPCPPGTGVYLMRYVGSDPLYGEGEKLRQAGRAGEAREIHERFLAKYPGSLAGQFVVGLESYDLKDWARMEQAFGRLETFFPKHPGILYNRAVALEELGRYGEAAVRLRKIVKDEPANYAALIHLYWSLRKGGEARAAARVLGQMTKTFPDNAEVARLASEKP